MQQEPGNPQIVRDSNTQTGSHLELPLSGHYLSIRSTNPDPGIQASTIVSLDDLTPVHPIGSNTTIVRTLWSREPMLGPAQRTTVNVQQRVFLFDAEPRLFGEHCVVDLLAGLTMIGSGWCSVKQERFAQHQDVVAATERIFVDRYRVEIDVGVGAGGLAG